MERGFDEFLGLPFSVDDGAGYLSSCDSSSVAAQAATTAAAAAASFEQPSNLGSGLGPLLPLPLLYQNRVKNVSKIVEQPTDLRLLTTRLVDRAKAFVRAHPTGRWFTYFAFGHVHTATASISADRQYSGCAYAGKTARHFMDGLMEVDGAIGELMGTIHSLGLANTTLTIFTSDNGPSLRWETGAGSAGVFTGAAAAFANGTRYANTAKGSTWEGGLRMPAFVHWPSAIAAGSTSFAVVSTLDVLPSLMRVVGRPPPTGRVIDGTLSLADAILGDGTAHTRHAFLPLYNEPRYGNASHRIFAARAGRYKVHWIASPGLGGGLLPYSSPSPEATHTRPLIFDVEADPSEAFPLDDAALPPTLRADVAAAKAKVERGLKPTSISPAWGYEHALCCGIGCTQRPCHCNCKDVPLPLALPPRAAER